jgi:hypothetical protein
VKVAESFLDTKGVLMPNAIMAKLGNMIDLAEKTKMFMKISEMRWLLRHDMNLRKSIHGPY